MSDTLYERFSMPPDPHTGEIIGTTKKGASTVGIDGTTTVLIKFDPVKSVFFITAAL